MRNLELGAVRPAKLVGYADYLIASAKALALIPDGLSAIKAAPITTNKPSKTKTK
jgi:NADPH:quinone reductase-like Zn-dependent oxidoreductase